MLVVNNLGVYESDGVVRFLFQFRDLSGVASAPSVTPVFRIYMEDAGSDWIEITTSAIGTSAGLVTGQYKGKVEVDDWDGLGAALDPGRYIVYVFTLDNGLDNSSYFQFDVSPTHSAEALAAKVDYVYTAFFTPGVTDITEAIEDSVWDAPEGSHVAAGTFGVRTFSATDISNVKSALSIGTSYTAGNDVESLKTIADVLHAVAIGRWKINAINKTLTFYELDGTTPLVTFELFNSDGTPATKNVAERLP